MKKSIILLLAALLLTLSAFQLHRQNHDLKFISFNIRLGSSWSKGQDGPHYWDNRKEAVVSMIRQENPDAIGMQEVLPNQLAYLDSALTDYQRLGVGREDGKSQGEHMAIFFKKDRLELVKGGTYWLSQTPDSVSMGWDAACHRTVTMALLRDRQTGRQLLYMNTHLDHMGPVARAESTKLLTRLAAQWAGDNIPILIGGDMNSNERDTIFNSFFHAGLANCRDMAPTADTAYTYNAFGKGAPNRIDHFFHRGLTLKSFRTLNGDYGIPYISDHYPVELIFFFD